MAVKAPADQLPADQLLSVLATAVDATFYRKVYPELAERDPLKHYATEGWREGRDPAPWFSSGAYLAANDDVRRKGHEPLSHFLARGAREGREAVPSEHAGRYFAAVEGWPEPWSFEALSLAGERAIAAAAFDAPYYFATQPDILAAGLDPLGHFLASGWREGRDPAAWFSCDRYLAANPDVAESGENPFVHYLRVGRAEGRPLNHDLGFRYDILARMRPLEARRAFSLQASNAVSPASRQRLAEQLSATGSDLSRLHVTFSHDEYAAVVGGVQLSIRRESARFMEAGFDHLHVFPAAPWLLVRERGEPGPLGVLLNGRHLGAYAARDIRAVLGGCGPGERRSFAIHSLLGHAPEEVEAIVAALGMNAGWFWLHDFASLCAGVHLLRNDVEDCAAPPPGSAACSVCAYGEFRDRHLTAHRRLFQRLDLTVVSPSQLTLDFWRASTRLAPRRTVVAPHATLEPRAAAPPRAPGPLRVAFLGLPTPLKGWPIFRELATRFADDPRYAFLHLGGRPEPGLPVAFHPVEATPGQPEAMREAVEAIEVDVALVWSLCRETFSFTAYEAVAGGAAVVTWPDSGNVAAFVAEGRHGRVLDDEAALQAAFADGAILQLARDIRGAGLYDMTFSGLTADLALA